LVHSAVVRQLTVLGRVSAGLFIAAPSVKSFVGRSGNFHAVVFVQKHASRQIVGAAEISLS
jgi:hypothetical protein